ncbi:MAG TPA: zf-HC2 domain-containing protein [Terriglobales bacterium]|nr:zf-HC2 domain-containing protein [Terriglobales bacterium]
MVVTCEQVWQEISNYLENDLSPELRAAMQDHFRQCKHCTAVLDGTRNVIHLYGDGRLFQLPMGFSWRLRRRLSRAMRPRRGTAFGWLVAVAALGLIAGGVTLASSTPRRVALRSEHAQAGHGIPAGLVVLVAAHSKVFHLPGCRFLHDKDEPVHSMKAEEAIKEGYVPCVRCLGKYVAHLAAEFIRKHAWRMA